MSRRIAFAAVAALHLGGAGLLLGASATTAAMPPVGAPAMFLLHVAAPRMAPPPPVIPVPLEVATDVAAPVFDMAPPEVSAATAETQGAALSSAATDCDLTASIAARLRSDPAVLVALAAIPRGSRSVANAVTLWNGDWASAVTLGGRSARTRIRQAVIAAIAAAPAACREAPQAGPRLVLVAEASGTTILSLGSGAWAWRQLVETSGDAGIA
jgi:hypothetical protein